MLGISDKKCFITDVVKRLVDYIPIGSRKKRCIDIYRYDMVENTTVGDGHHDSNCERPLPGSGLAVVSKD